MIRAYQNNERIATATKLREGGILQVYPSKEKFETEDAWKSKYEGAEFKEEDKKSSSHKKRKAWVENHLDQYLYDEVDSDTPMQKLVRKLYAQYGIPDSISPAVQTDTIHYSQMIRYNPGLYVLLLDLGKIVHVVFNRKSGRVYIDYKDAIAMSPAGLLFFTNPHDNRMEVAKPLEQVYSAEKKVVVFWNSYWRIKEDRTRIQALIDAGFYVKFYHNKRSPNLDTVNALYALPNVKALMQTNYGSWYDVAVFQPGVWKAKSISIVEWIAKNK